MKAYGYDQRLEVHCEKGLLQVENAPISFFVQNDVNGRHTDRLQPFFPERYDQAYETQLVHFFSCIEGKVKPLTTPKQVICGARIAELALQSILNRDPSRFIQLSLPKFDHSLTVKGEKRLEKDHVCVALIGSGRIGSVRAEHLSRNPRTKLKWIIDTDEKIVSQVASLYGVKYSTRLLDALEDREIDAVWVVSTLTSVKLLIL